jgi:hypothetical protein
MAKAPRLAFYVASLLQAASLDFRAFPTDHRESMRHGLRHEGPHREPCSCEIITALILRSSFAIEPLKDFVIFANQRVHQLKNIGDVSRQGDITNFTFDDCATSHLADG